MKTPDTAKKRMGRPPLDPEVKRHVVTTRMNNAERAMVWQYARRTGLTLCEAIRELALKGAISAARTSHGVAP